jgi:hypothetical protein
MLFKNEKVEVGFDLENVKRAIRKKVKQNGRAARCMFPSKFEKG